MQESRIPLGAHDPIRDLQVLIDRHWAAVRATWFPDAADGWCLTPKGKVPPLARALAPDEAANFLRAIEEWLV